MKPIIRPIVGLLALTVALLMTSCKDTPANVGSSLQPNSDWMSSRMDSIELDVRTIPLESVYNLTTYTLLGDLTDPFYGQFSASYISRLQYTPGFNFSYEPLNGVIDSVMVEAVYVGMVGDSTVWNKAQVFEVQKELPKSHFSVKSLDQYVDNAKLIGELNYQTGSKTNKHELRIPVDKAIGYRFLEASKQHQEYFETQDAFDQNLMNGLYVRNSTGAGSVVSVFETGLLIYYSRRYETKTSKGVDTVYNKVEVEKFVNTKRLYNLNQLKHEGIEQLLAPNDKFCYAKSPAGVVPQFTFKASDLTALYKHYEQMAKEKADLAWMINSASLALDVEPLEQTTRMDPPAYLMILPTDSVTNFFARGETDETMRDIAYLSNQYTIKNRRYEFKNFASLIEKHIRAHGKTDAQGQPVVDVPLTFVLVPVQREVANNNSKKTLGINNYMYPSAVQLKSNVKARTIGISSTAYIENK